MFNKICKFCGKEFSTPSSKTIYCNHICYNNDPNSKQRNRLRINKKCINCNKIMRLQPSRINSRKFCSQTCANQYNQKDGSWNKGIPHTKEEKLKIGKGVKLSRINTNYINPSTRPEVRAKISKTIKELFKDPKNNPRYIDERKAWEYPFAFNKYFKETIRARDKYTCQDCGITKENYPRALDVHHIDGNRHNLNGENLISLCKSCHVKRHGIIKEFNKRRNLLRRL